jgi:putative membrane protein
MKEKVLIYLKGFLMGICDIIPGISGGTIAFITGIYVRLINAVKGFSLKLVYDILTYPIHRQSDDLRQDIKKLDLVFLIILLLGIASAFLAASRVIKFLMEEYFAYTISFFIGLILASSMTIFEHIEDHSIKNIMFCVLGFILGVASSMLVPLTVTPSLGYVFLGGFCAINAMFLPGISGAFILLIMGLYEFMVGVLNDLRNNIAYFLVFAAGAALGAFTISRIISFLFKRYRCRTLYVLLGLVIGALGTPVKRIAETASFQVSNVLIMLFWCLLGAALVVLMGRYRKSYERKTQAVEKE